MWLLTLGAYYMAMTGGKGRLLGCRGSLVTAITSSMPNTLSIFFNALESISDFFLHKGSVPGHLPLPQSLQSDSVRLSRTASKAWRRRHSGPTASRPA